MGSFILQKITKKSEDSFALAEMYYSILSVINSLKLTNREIQLLAYSAVKGNLSNANVKEGFKNKYDTSLPTVTNIISRLRKIGVLIKKDRKIIINPVIALDFEQEVHLNIRLYAEAKQEVPNG